ncbi:Gfo/Idh/MocA family oxidoreductase [bacterium]|nr:Gfo/Idh/MocA family oxidoreductase [bacterium]
MADNVRNLMVVGAGQSGSAFVKRILKFGEDGGVRLTAIVDPDKEKSAALIREFPDSMKPELLSNLGSMSRLNDDTRPEAAIICVPASVHMATATACMSKGMHCLLEKPMGFSALDCKELSAKALEYKRHIQGAFLDRWLFAGLWNSWKPSSGLWTINAIRTGPFVPRSADTSVMHDMMIRDLDLFVLLSRVFSLPKIANIRAWGRKLRSDRLDYAIVSLDLEDGGMARFFSSRLSSETLRGWQLSGKDWHANLNFLRKSLKRFEQVGRSSHAFQAVETRLEHADPVSHELDYFLKTLEEQVPVEASLRTDFTDLSTMRAFPHNLAETHELVDRILSTMKVLKV